MHDYKHVGAVRDNEGKVIGSEWRCKCGAIRHQLDDPKFVSKPDIVRVIKAGDGSCERKKHA